MVVPNSCFTVIAVDRLSLPGVPQTEYMTANFDEGSFNVYGNWINATISSPKDGDQDEFSLKYSVFVTYNKTVFGQRISGLIGVSPSLPEDKRKSFYHMLSE